MKNTTEFPERNYDRFISEIGRCSVSTGASERICHAYDATNKFVFPDLVVRPSSIEELHAVVKAANVWKIPLIPRGAGTGFSGGSLGVRGGAVVDLLQFDKIVDLDEDDMTVYVEPGVIVRDIHEAVESRGLYYPPDPASLKTCTIGGNIAENAGGPHCLKYGVTRDYVMVIDGITGGGDIFSAGKAVHKNRAGYDLKQLLVGSEGTLAIFTGFRLKLIAKPEKKILFLAFFSELVDAAKTVNLILKSGIVPSSVEFMDKNTIMAVENFAKFGLPTQHEALLLIEIDGRADETVASRKIAESVLSKHAKLVQFADDKNEQEKLWEIRRKASPAMRAYGNTKINEDIVVPRKHVPTAIRRLWETGERNNVKVISFGHIGDGNIHVNIMHDGNNAQEVKRAKVAVGEIFEMVNSLGGAISGEHGIGTAKMDFLPGNIDNTSLELMRNIKKTFDPNNILNPGKIFNL
ncbi:MAG: FAD-binding protein [Candidatus Riflebacteria bacterium]|nr:FAD-binding protein [Candidatus Riflebacteria bacterium]